MDKTVGFTCGSFDLLHPGHVIMFKDCKTVCDYLIVGVQSDPTIDRPEKNKPVQSHLERIGMVSSLKYVDDIIPYNTEQDLYRHLELLVERTKRDGDKLIRIIGSDWKGEKYTGHKLSIKIYFHRRDHDYSTSNLRKRIVEAEKLSPKKVIDNVSKV